ncbi:phosphate acyltransferase [Youngiibacter fragilis]|uniref:Phosphate acetyl/butyryl transferase n=1 Tax=Youngiibacter fragilis 232.1 TaxID=994573 RepID=V7I2X3_9CLOT|nr:phosphate acyltransferase [Youngiibacter fragilis]ETA80218.1 phosphate acetyl/butyryl transferase [Youngiibacter fragilis 232.1]
MRTLTEIITSAKGQSVRTAVACAGDWEVLEAILSAVSQGLVEPILYGDGEKISTILYELGTDPECFSIVSCPSDEEACRAACKACSEGGASILMKGFVDTKVILKAVLSEGLVEDGGLLSHVMTFGFSDRDKLLMVSDGGVVMFPGLYEKSVMIRNAKRLADALELSPFKVACLSAVEKVNPKLQSTIDGLALKEMSGKPGFEEIIIEGPISFDLAVSEEAARIKGYDSPVAGNADMLLVPDLEAGNILAKSMTYMAGGDSAGLVLGAKVPIVLVSRADSSRVKLNSIALAVLVAKKGEG